MFMIFNLNNQEYTMKRLSLLLFITLSTVFIFAENKTTNKTFAQTGNDRFVLKTQGIMGFYIDVHSNMSADMPSAPTGLMFGVEFPSSQQRPWQQYLMNPTVGLGMTYLNLGSERFGHTVALYPYILLNCVRTRYFEMQVKLAAGLGVVNEHWYTQEDTNVDHYYDATTNAIFGCYLNAYLNAGLNLKFPITRNFAINGEFGFIHMSNGRTYMPNVGANIFYGGIGMTATINPEEEREPIHFPNLPYKWSLNITAAGGIQAAEIEPHKFPVASFHTGAVYNVCNWYSVGGGIDIFFNDAISKNTRRNLYCKFEEHIDREDHKYKDLSHTYTFTDKLRVGVAINNEFKFGMLTTIFDWGVYLYNPSRNYYCDYVKEHGQTKRPLFYKSSGPGNEEAFHYFRFGLKCRVWDNLYLQATCKTHMQIAELVEFGINYQIPFLRKEKREEGKSIIFHHKKGWWKN